VHVFSFLFLIIIIIIIIDDYANTPSQMTVFYAIEQNLTKTYLSSLITSDTKPTHMKQRIVMAKEVFILHQQIGLNLRNKLMKCYIWSIRLYGADTWTLRKKKNQKYLDSLEMW